MLIHLLQHCLFTITKRTKAATIALLLALAFIACPVSSQGAYYIWKVADQNTKVPGYYSGNHYFKYFGVPAIDGDNVVWYALGSLEGVFGIFIHDRSTFTASSVHVVVTSLTYPPGESVQFNDYGARPSVDGQYVTFMGAASGASFANEMGIYQALYTGVSLPTVYKVADRGTSGLDTGTTLFYPDGASVDDAAFIASFTGSDSSAKFGVFTKYGGTLKKVADSDTTRPGGTAKFLDFARRPSMDGSMVLFYGVDSSSVIGLYGSYYPFSTLIKVADSNDKAPGSNSKYTYFFSLSLHNNIAAFYAVTTGGKGVYAGPVGGAMKRLVDSSVHSLIEPMAATSHGHYAFVSGPGYPILWHHDGSTRYPVVSTSSLLDKKWVNSIFLGPQGISKASIAFLVKFTDQTQAIYRADQLNTLGYDMGTPLALATSQEEYGAGLPFTWNLAISGDDLGLGRALWVAPEYAGSHSIKVSGNSIYSVTPPEGVDPENLYQLVVFDPETGAMLMDPVEVPGGSRLDFRELGFGDGVQSFAIRGASLDEGYEGRMPVGLVFSRADAVVNVEARRCSGEFERCGEE
jgi:hypothetical protein